MYQEGRFLYVICWVSSPHSRYLQQITVAFAIIHSSVAFYACRTLLVPLSTRIFCTINQICINIVGWITDVPVHIVYLPKLIYIRCSFVKMLQLQNCGRALSINNPRYFKQYKVKEFLIHERLILSHKFFRVALLAFGTIRSRTEVGEMRSQNS